MRDDPIHIEPARLLDADSEAARALRAARADPSLQGDQPAAWQNLRPRLSKTGWDRLGRHVVLGAAAGLLLVAGGLGLWRHSAPGPVPAGPVVSVLPVTRAGELPVDLPSGPSALGDGTRLELSSQGRAQIRRDHQRLTVALVRGSIEVAVTARPVGREFQVEADGYRFSVVGTRFRVALRDESIELQVQEGRVAVFGTSAPLATVSAGESWQGSLRPRTDREPPVQPTSSRSGSTPEPASSIPSAATSEAAADCLRLARENQSGSAASCYERVARGRGLSAEMAQVELARLRRDVLHDAPGALRALRDYLSRYPNGAFYTEAAVSLVELLVQSGQIQPALGESERLLVSGAARERQGELRLLRGRILQDKLGDCGRAEREYASVAGDPGPVGDQAQLRRAQCLEALGRSDEAITTYRAYLDRPSPASASIARARLGVLSGGAP